MEELKREEATGCSELGQHLQTLLRLNKPSFVQSFIDEQQTHAGLYSSQGKLYFDSWRDGSPSSVELGRKTITNTLTLDLGTATPILKPRHPQPFLKLSIETNKEKGHEETASGSLSRGTHLASRVTEDEKSSSKRRQGADDDQTASAKTKVTFKPSKPPKKQGEVSKNSFDDSNARQSLNHAERLKARRAKRKARREIVRPREELSDGQASSQKRGGMKKANRPKIPAGLALMHGFHATNVGKSRLTMERTAAGPPGVFSKGKASIKTTTAKRKETKRCFSELKFLEGSASRSKYEEVDASSTSPSSRSDTTSSSSRTPLKKKHKRRNPALKDNEKQLEETGEKPENRNEVPNVECARSESVTWDIERDSAVLPSTDLPITLLKRDPGIDATVNSSPALGTSKATHSNVSLLPSDSVSRCVVLTEIAGAKDLVVSKFFQAGPSLSRKEETEVLETGTYLVLPNSSTLDAAGGPETVTLEVKNIESLYATETVSAPFGDSFNHAAGHAVTPDGKDNLFRNMGTIAVEYPATPSSIMRSDYDEFHLCSEQYIELDALRRHSYQDTIDRDVDVGHYSHEGFAQTDWNNDLVISPVEQYTQSLCSEGALPPVISPWASPSNSIVGDNHSIMQYHGSQAVANNLAQERLELCAYENYIRYPSSESVYGEASIPATWIPLEDEPVADVSLVWHGSTSGGEVEEGTFEHDESSEVDIERLQGNQGQLCHFLQGRSLLLCGSIADGLGSNSWSHGQMRMSDSVSRAEIDVVKSLKNYWRPQKL